MHSNTHSCCTNSKTKQNKSHWIHRTVETKPRLNHSQSKFFLSNQPMWLCQRSMQYLLIWIGATDVGVLKALWYMCSERNRFSLNFTSEYRSIDYACAVNEARMRELYELARYYELLAYWQKCKRLFIVMHAYFAALPSIATNFHPIHTSYIFHHTHEYFVCFILHQLQRLSGIMGCSKQSIAKSDSFCDFCMYWLGACLSLSISVVCYIFLCVHIVWVCYFVCGRFYWLSNIWIAANNLRLEQFLKIIWLVNKNHCVFVCALVDSGDGGDFCLSTA